MNSFICSVDRPFKFFGRLNEDVNTYVTLGNRGKLFLTMPQVMLHQKATQQNPGGMSDIYLDKGTYIKSFYSVMYCPSAVRVDTMGDKYERRIHHQVRWRNAVPMIIREKWRKAGEEYAPF